MELEQRIVHLEQRICQLEKYIQQHIQPINEQFYQMHLEKIYNGTHQRNEHGISDIETDTELIEIKHWKNYKQVYGQLYAYDPQRTKKWIVYLFGKSPHKTDIIIEYFKSKNIELWKLEYDRNTDMVFRECLIDEKDEDLIEFIETYIVEDSYSYITKREITKTFRSIYNKRFDENDFKLIIYNKYHIEWKKGKIILDNGSYKDYKGWRGLKLKDDI